MNVYSIGCKPPRRKGFALPAASCADAVRRAAKIQRRHPRWLVWTVCTWIPLENL